MTNSVIIITQRHISKKTLLVETIKCWPLTAINYKKKINIIFQKVQRAASKGPKSRKQGSKEPQFGHPCYI